MFCCCQSLFFLGRNEEVNGNDTRNLTTCGLSTDTEWGGSCGLSTDTEGHPAGWRPLFLWPPLIASFKGVSLLLNTRLSDKGMEGHEWCRRSLNIALYGGSFCVEHTPGGTCRIKRIVSNLKRDRGGYSNQCKITTPEEGSSVFANQLPSSCAIQLRELASFITKFCIIDTCNTDKCIINMDQQKNFQDNNISKKGNPTIRTSHYIDRADHIPHCNTSSLVSDTRICHISAHPGPWVGTL